MRRLRQLQPEMLVTGRHEPIVGAELIDASLARLHDAVDWVHRQTLDGINAGTDLWTMMQDIRFPRHLRVGEGYGKVAWAVRTIWETYVGWFKLRSTSELYPDRHTDAMGLLVDAVGVSEALELARRALGRGDAVEAILLAEGILGLDAEHVGAARLVADAHRSLLDVGGDVSFWESGWLESEAERSTAHAEDPAT